MNYVLVDKPVEDAVQLLNSSNVAVTGLSDTDLNLFYRKNGDAGYTQKLLAPSDVVDRGDGIYTLQFTAGELDTEGLFLYYVTNASPGTFQTYYSSLYVTDALPSFPKAPPTISAQTATPPGVSPDPVARGTTLTISGTDLDGATAVSVGGVACTITSNTSSEIQVTVGSTHPLGAGQVVEVSTAGGSVTSTVEVVLNPSEIPGSGLIALTGTCFSTKQGTFLEGASVYGRVLDMPNIAMGVAWSDEVATVTTNSSGEFSISMPRGVRVEISIPKIQYHRQFITPDASTKDIFTEIP